MPAVTIILKNMETIGDDSVYIGPIEHGQYNEYKEELTIRMYSGKKFSFKKNDIALFSKTLVMSGREHEIVILPKEEDIDEALKSLCGDDSLSGCSDMQKRKDIADSQGKQIPASKDLPVVK